MAYKDKEKERQNKKGYYKKNKKKILENKKRYYQKNKERILKRTRLFGKKWYQKNIKKMRLHHREYYQENKEKVLQYHKEWYQKNKERILQQCKEYCQKNREKIRRRHRKYNQEHKKERLEYKGKWQKYQRKTNPRYRLDANMGTAIWTSLKDKKAGRKWETLVSYTLKELIEYLEKQFNSKMNWDNYGGYWAVDHVKPRSLFNYTSPENLEFKQCWALKNLQPLEKIENIKKRNHYIG